MVRTAVVTGHSSGLGAAVGDRLRRDGWDVVGIDVTESPGTVVADITNEQSLAEVAASLGDRRIEALVCAAGIWSQEDDRYASVDIEIWERTWRVNVTGTMLSLRHFAPRLEAGGGVVTIASVAAIDGMPRRDAYTASKGAIVALTRAWATDLIRRGVRVNCIAPGVVDTPMTRAQSSAEGLDLPLGRMARPEEIADIAVATLSRDATYLNGAVIPVDGGLTATSRLAVITPR